MISEILRTARTRKLKLEQKYKSLRPGKKHNDADEVNEMVDRHMDSFYDPIVQVMQEVCVCGHTRERHYDATDDCDFRNECGCIDFKTEGEVTNR